MLDNLSVLSTTIPLALYSWFVNAVTLNDLTFIFTSDLFYIYFVKRYFVGKLRKFFIVFP